MTNQVNNSASLTVEQVAKTIAEKQAIIKKNREEIAELRKSPAFHEADCLRKRQYHDTINKNAKLGAKVADLIAKGDFEAIKALKLA
jgi:hypothetical protein